MEPTPDFVHPLLETAEWETFSPGQRGAIEEVLHKARVARDIHRSFLDTRTLGARLSDTIAQFGGSWPFILLFVFFLVVWVIVNTKILSASRLPFDPYPFIFLNLILSMVAALQAPVIMMAQNRQSARDRIEAASDYQVNLKAELEIQRLHEKMDGLRESQWGDLVRMQQQQIEMLGRLLAERLDSSR